MTSSFPGGTGIGAALSQMGFPQLPTRLPGQVTLASTQTRAPGTTPSSFGDATSGFRAPGTTPFAGQPERGTRQPGSTGFGMPTTTIGTNQDWFNQQAAQYGYQPPGTTGAPTGASGGSGGSPPGSDWAAINGLNDYIARASAQTGV